MRQRRRSVSAFQLALSSPPFRATVRCVASPPVPPLTPSSHVLVTAPAPYAARLASLLISSHQRPIWVPTIETVPLCDPADTSALQAALLNLPAYAVLAFTSRTGMREVGRQLLELANGDADLSSALLEGSGVRIAALGNDATGAKECLGVTADLVPLTASPAGLVQFLAADEALRGASVLCPVPAVKGMVEPPVVPEFLEALKESGFDVTAVPAYETRPVRRALLQRELHMLCRGDVDAIAFSSAGEAYAFAAVLTGEERNMVVERVAKGDLVLAAHGPYTAEGVRTALGVADVTVSTDFSSFDGLVEVIRQTFVEREKREGRLFVPS